MFLISDRLLSLPEQKQTHLIEVAYSITHFCYTITSHRGTSH